MQTHREKGAKANKQEQTFLPKFNLSLMVLPLS